MATQRYMPSVSSSREPEVQIGDFMRMHEIGKGSFATVYLAKHRSKRSYVAVKAVTQGKLTKKLKENLESEISILRSLQHPHIVALFDCIETPHYIHLVMEYCQMSDLAHFMKTRTQMDELAETREIFRKYPNPPAGGLNEVLARHFLKQVVSALQYLRLRNLIHRDIKPQNLLLNPPPTYMLKQRPEDVPLAASDHSLVPAVGVASLPMLKIADFGFARHLPQASLAETLCGSPLYMAPEILGYKKYDAKADLWSVGAVAYEMVVGKPPFRAANHVDLLRKIDQALDVIQFPAGLVVSRDYKTMIRSLLKRQPTERTSFERFFAGPVITGEIPGLVGEDVPRVYGPGPDPGISEISRRRMEDRMKDQAIDSPAQTRPIDIALSTAVQDMMAPGPRVTPLNSFPKPPANVRRSSAATTARQITPDATQPANPPETRRPPFVSMATAPARQEVYESRTPPAAMGTMQRRSNRPTASPSSSAPQRSSLPEHARRISSEEKARELTAQDLAFEREYVMIDKRSTEVNAFADELAARQLAPNHHAALVRRATTQGAPGPAAGTQIVNQGTAMQLVTGRRADPTHNRRPSFERRYAPNPASATNVLKQALSMANNRLFGAGTSPPFFGRGTTPPDGYGAFPQYAAPVAPLAISDGRDSSGPLDEDSRMVRIVEEAATRSDVVHSFAEVKYRQLLPATPSAEDGLVIHQINAHEQPLRASGDAPDDDLTHVAFVAVAEEAFVLYVKALAILVRTINFVRYWWDHHRISETQPGSLPTRPNDVKPLSTAEINRKMNNVVQWARSRFNECLEKSEVVGRKLVEAQKQLPASHPGHPSNHPPLEASESGNNFGPPVEQINLTSGVTAEKLMFDRALEMSRAAAINELTGSDFSNCELSYVTALMLFEAVLENDDEPLMNRPSANRSKPGDEIVNGMESEDRKTVVKMIEATRSRLDGLRKKIAQQNAAKRLSVAPASKGPSRTSSSPVTATGVSPR